MVIKLSLPLSFPKQWFCLILLVMQSLAGLVSTQGNLCERLKSNKTKLQGLFLADEKLCLIESDRLYTIPATDQYILMNKPKLVLFNQTGSQESIMSPELKLSAPNIGQGLKTKLYYLTILNPTSGSPQMESVYIEVESGKLWLYNQQQANQANQSSTEITQFTQTIRDKTEQKQLVFSIKANKVCYTLPDNAGKRINLQPENLISQLPIYGFILNETVLLWDDHQQIVYAFSWASMAEGNAAPFENITFQNYFACSSSDGSQISGVWMFTAESNDKWKFMVYLVCALGGLFIVTVLCTFAGPLQ